MAEHRNGNVKNANSKASAAANTYTINLENFSKRLKMFYSHWNEYKGDLWGASDALASLLEIVSFEHLVGWLRIPRNNHGVHEEADPFLV